jgi:hypothetical protein
MVVEVVVCKNSTPVCRVSSEPLYRMVPGVLGGPREGVVWKNAAPDHHGISVLCSVSQVTDGRL